MSQKRSCVRTSVSPKITPNQKIFADVGTMDKNAVSVDLEDIKEAIVENHAAQREAKVASLMLMKYKFVDQVAKFGDDFKSKVTDWVAGYIPIIDTILLPAIDTHFGNNSG